MKNTMISRHVASHILSPPLLLLLVMRRDVTRACFDIVRWLADTTLVVTWRPVTMDGGGSGGQVIKWQMSWVKNKKRI